MISEAQKRASSKFKKKHIKQLVINCYERDMDLYNYAREEGRKINSISDYVKGLIEADRARKSAEGNECES